MASPNLAPRGRGRKQVVLGAVGAVVVATIGASTTLALAVRAQLPAIYSMADYRPPSASRVVASGGEVIGTFAYERRTPICVRKLPAHVRFAFIAAEDADFYQHEGIDWWGVARAIGKNLRPRARLQGGSTITQQTVKTLVVGPERSLWRKVREAVLARRLEQFLGKDAILELYLNQIYFGHGAWGIEEAAQTYFGVPAESLTALQAATLAAAPKNPTRYVLDGDRAALRGRRRYVLAQMAAHGWLPPSSVAELASAPLPTLPPASIWPQLSRDYVEHVRRVLQSELGEEMLYAGGLTIEVGMSAPMQRAAVQAVRQSLMDLAGRRPVLPKPWMRFGPALFAEVYSRARRTFAERPSPPCCLGCSAPKWVWDWQTMPPPEPAGAAGAPATARSLGARFARPFAQFAWPVVELDPSADALTLDAGSERVVLRASDGWPSRRRQRSGPRLSDHYRKGDVVLVEVQPRTGDALRVRLVPRGSAQAALVAIEPATRAVRALVGAAPGTPAGGFNRATQAKRQPGSAFKPILYAAALEAHAITPATLCDDAPIRVVDPDTGAAWRPENYEGGRYDGLIPYRVALARSKNVCSVRLLQQVGIEPVRELAYAMGIDRPLPNHLPLALGAGEVTVLALTNAMATLANGGMASAAQFVVRVLGPGGEVIFVPPAAAPVQALSAQAAYVTTHMLQGVVEQGTARRAMLLGRPAAGKTGTSQQSRDLWFTGYTPQLAASVWMGHDDNTPLGRETGGSAALPAWIRFMGAALATAPATPFTEPAHIVHMAIDPITGAPSSAAASGTAPPPARPAAEAEGAEPDPDAVPSQADFAPSSSPAAAEAPAAIDEIFIEGTQPIIAGTLPPSIYLQDDAAHDG